MTDVLLLVVGLICAVAGAEFFLRGAVGIAESLRVPARLIAVTVAAFATSTPELSVAINASIEGVGQIALGDAVGANVANLTLIVGIGVLFGTVKAPLREIQRDLLVVIAVPAVITLLGLDGELSRFDGLVLIVIFVGWLALVVREALAARALPLDHDRLVAASVWRAPLFALLGLVLLVAAGSFIVDGARGIALALGLDTFIVGATIVAIGTTAPELATTVISNLRGHSEVGLGNLLGSNIFNGLFIVGIAAMIRPISITAEEVGTGLAFGLVASLAIIPLGGVIQRWRGPVLIALYIAYTYAILVLVGGVAH
jgi:cation:H+ antiporter